MGRCNSLRCPACSIERSWSAAGLLGFAVGFGVGVGVGLGVGVGSFVGAFVGVGAFAGFGVGVAQEVAADMAGPDAASATIRVPQLFVAQPL